MIPMPSGVRVWLATGHTDMRRGFPSLALQVQEVLKHDPLGGHLFCFRGRRSDLIKVIWHDSQGACLFTKRLERDEVAVTPHGRSVIAIADATACRRRQRLAEGVTWLSIANIWLAQG